MLALVESRRNPGPATLGQHEAVLSGLRRAGFAVLEAGVAFAALDSYVRGYVLQDRNRTCRSAPARSWTSSPGNSMPSPRSIPHLTEMLRAYARQPTAFPDAFEVGLDLLLDGLERRRLAEAQVPTSDAWPRFGRAPARSQLRTSANMR